MVEKPFLECKFTFCNIFFGNRFWKVFFEIKMENIFKK